MAMPFVCRDTSFTTMPIVRPPEGVGLVALRITLVLYVVAGSEPATHSG